MLRKKVWQKKIVHGDGIKRKILHITIPENKFPASSKSPTHPQKLNGRPLIFNHPLFASAKREPISADCDK